MRKFTSFIKNTGVLALLAFPLSAAAGDSISIYNVRFPEAFASQLEGEGIDNFDVNLNFFATADEAVFPEDLAEAPSGTYSAWSHSVCLDEPVKVANTETLKLYYYLSSSRIMMEKGYVEIPSSELRNGIEINPEKYCKKVVLKRSVGVDGVPVPTYFWFVRNHNSRKFRFNVQPGSGMYDAITLNHEERRDEETGEVLPPQMMTTTFWTEPGREIPYLVISEGQYFMHEGSYQMTDAAVPDTIGLDYRKAKKVSFGVKRVNGEPLDLRSLSGSDTEFSNCNFQTKFSTGPEVLVSQYTTIVNVMPNQQVDFKKPVKTLDFYAFPGVYIFSFWSNNGFQDVRDNLCPKGLEGRLVVGDEAEQRVDFDFGKYVTLNVKTDAAPAFKGKSFLAKSKTPLKTANALLNNFNFSDAIGMTSSYSRVKAGKNPGAFDVQIWPAVGYDLLDIEGKVYDTEVVKKDVDLHKDKVVDVYLTKMYTLRCVVPAYLKVQQSSIHIGEETLVVNKYDNADGLHPGFFEKMDTLSFFRQAGEYPVYFKVERHVADSVRVYTSDVKQVKLGDSEETLVELPWNRAVILEDHSPRRPSYVLLDDAKGFYAGGAYGNGASLDDETLFLFEEPGEYQFKMSAWTYAHQNKQVTVTDGLTRMACEFVGYSKFRLNIHHGADRNCRVTWVGKNGETTDVFSYRILKEEDSVVVHAEPGWVDVVIKAAYDKEVCEADHAFRFDMAASPLPEIDASLHAVQFKRGDSYLPLFGRLNDEAQGEVKVYMIKSPWVDEKLPLKMRLGEDAAQPQIRATVELIPGFYCAEDGEGNKVNFEVKADQTDVQVVDFKDPEPPTGIGEVTETVQPAAYYDLSGRRIAVLRKGVNLVRLPDGTVKKVMGK